MRTKVGRLTRTAGRSEGGQILVLFTLALVFVLVLASALVIDGGNAFAQRRAAQNAADFAAQAGTQYVMADAVATPKPFQDSHIRDAIVSSLQANGFDATTYAAQYVDASGNPIPGATVGSIVGGAVPNSARGVRVDVNRQFATSLLSHIGIAKWTAGASATARGAFTPGLTVPAGDLLPIALNYADYVTHTKCPYGKAATDPSCSGSFLDLGDGTGTGQHGWMAWPAFSQNAGDLATMLTPPLPAPAYTIPSNGYIAISGNTGKSNSNAVRDAIAALAASGATYWIPLFSPGPPGTFPNGTPYPEAKDGTGSNSVLNIIGFAGFQITGCLSNPCIGQIGGVLRVASFLGPTGITSDVYVPGSSVAISLVR